MKTLEELQKIKDKAQESVRLRQAETRCTLKVALGTCGIAAGARTVMAAILDELGKRDVKDVIVTQSGCMGYCDQEPIVEVIDDKGNKVRYGKVDVNSARKIVAEHVINGNVVENLVFMTN
jgi:(2Fe-2S) ferredoxin